MAFSNSDSECESDYDSKSESETRQGQSSTSGRVPSPQRATSRRSGERTAQPASNSPRMSSSHLNTNASLSALGTVQVNLDLGGLQNILQGLTSALELKFETMCNQMSEMQVIQRSLPCAFVHIPAASSCGHGRPGATGTCGAGGAGLAAAERRGAAP
eukprot:4752251-Pleurochrysis_carterae.AAC.2